MLKLKRFDFSKLLSVILTQFFLRIGFKKDQDICENYGGKSLEWSFEKKRYLIIFFIYM